MNEQFYTELLSRIADFVDAPTLSSISEELTRLLNGYDVSKRETSLAVYEVVPECVKTYLVTKKIEGLKKTTLKVYGYRLKQFFEMTRLSINEVRTNDIRLWLYDLQKESVHMSDRTLDKARQCISSFFKWATIEGYIPSDPCVNVKKIKYTAKDREPLTEEELEVFRSGCNTPRDIAIVETLYSTGCRVSELVNIRFDDIDMQTGEIIVFGKGGKYRKVYLNAKSMLAIKNYVKSRHDNLPYLFVPEKDTDSEHISVRSVQRIINGIAERAGMARNVHPHLIRHTTATLSLKRGMDVVEIQKMLGHSNVETTMVYAKVDNDAVKRSHERYVV